MSYLYCSEQITQEDQLIDTFQEIGDISKRTNRLALILPRNQ